MEFYIKLSWIDKEPLQA